MHDRVFWFEGQWLIRVISRDPLFCSPSHGGDPVDDGAAVIGFGRVVRSATGNFSRLCFAAGSDTGALSRRRSCRCGRRYLFAFEEALEGLADLQELQCDSRESIGVAVAEMADGGSLIRFLDDIKTAVDGIRTFPAQAEKPVISQLERRDRVVDIAVTGPMTPGDLKSYAEQLKTRLKRLPGVAEVTVQGFSERQLRVTLSPLALREYGLSLDGIADIIARQSIDLPAGHIETRDRDLLIRFTDQRRSVAELEDLMVLQGKDSELKLGELATIEERFSDAENKQLLDGRRAAVLQVEKARSDDTLTVMDEVQNFVDQEQGHAPEGVRLTLTRNMSSLVRDRLSLLIRNGSQGLVLVFLVMWLFFRGRFAFWVAMGLPVSFLGGLFLLACFDYSINMISMVSLLIALGLVMDDAIVIAENVAAHAEQGKSPLQAAIDGTREVGPGVLASFLTTLAVFAPLITLQGDIGKVMRVLPVALIFVLTISLLEAFCILPRHLSEALGHGRSSDSRLRKKFEVGLNHFREQWLGRTVDWAVTWRYLFIGGVVGLFLVIVGILAGGHLKFRAFPQLEGNVIEARLLLPQGTPLSLTEQRVKQLTDGIARVNTELSPLQPAGRSLVNNVRVLFNQNLDVGEQGGHVATVVVDLLTAEQRRGVTLEGIMERWRQASGTLTDAVMVNFKEPIIGPGGLPIQIRLAGDNLDELKAASDDLQQWLGRYGGVSNLSDDLRSGKPELQLRLRDGALALGVDASMIARQLRGAFHGVTVKEFQMGPETVEIDLRLAEGQIGPGDLESFRITTADGRQLPLAVVTELGEGRGYSRIRRVDGRRMVTLTGDVDGRHGNAVEILQDTRQQFFPLLQQRYPGVKLLLEGQSQEAATTGKSLLRSFLLGMFGIFILLSLQFRSYSEPLVVMVVIPLALIGVVFGHMLMGLELSMPSMIGFVSLSGIVVNDSILLVAFLKRAVNRGHDVVSAACKASRERFRAVLLTSLTTVAGLLPLVLEKSLQAQVLIPLAVSIVFGLMASTILVLLVVPALFSILADFPRKRVEKAVSGDVL